MRMPTARSWSGQRLTLDKPNLWDVDSPNLYSVKCRLTDPGDRGDRGL